MPNFERKEKKQVKENGSMETGSSSEFLDRGKAMRDGTGKRHDVVNDAKLSLLWQEVIIILKS